MIERNNLTDSKRKIASTKAERLAAKIIKANVGAAVPSVKLAVTLSGPAAASWKALQEARGELRLDDAGIVGLLLDAGSSTVRQALTAAQLK